VISDEHVFILQSCRNTRLQRHDFRVTWRHPSRDRLLRLTRIPYSRTKPEVDPMLGCWDISICSQWMPFSGRCRPTPYVAYRNSDQNLGWQTGKPVNKIEKKAVNAWLAKRTTDRQTTTHVCSQGIGRTLRRSDHTFYQWSCVYIYTDPNCHSHPPASPPHYSRTLQQQQP